MFSLKKSSFHKLAMGLNRLKFETLWKYRAELNFLLFARLRDFHGGKPRIPPLGWEGGGMRINTVYRFLFEERGTPKVHQI
jgi:hypothetical protein